MVDGWSSGGRGFPRTDGLLAGLPVPLHGQHHRLDAQVLDGLVVTGRRHLTGVADAQGGQGSAECWGSNKAQPVQARLIAVSNAPLEREAAEDRFRQDLYYRLNVVGFSLPPLREQRSRIAPLVEKFREELTARDLPDVTGVSAEALGALEAYDWPGQHPRVAQRPRAGRGPVPGDEVGRADLVPRARPTTDRPGPATLQESLREAEALRIRQALEKHHNNRLRAALEFGISRKGLYKKLHNYGLLRGA